MAKRVMIVHRAPFMRNFLEEVLKKLGYEVTGKVALGEVVRNGDQLSFAVNEEILPAYQTQKPDAVLMDAFMEGNRITARILKTDKKAVVIGCSSELHEKANPNGFKAERKKMLDAGAKATIGLTPVNPSQFTEELKNLLEQVLKEDKKKWLGLF